MVTLSLDDSQLLEALSRGADGYFVQGQSPQALIAAIEQVLAGGAEMAPAIARQVKAHFDALSLEAHRPRRRREPAAPGPRSSAWCCSGSPTASCRTRSRATCASRTREVAQRVRTLYRKLQFDRRTATLSLQLA